MVSRVKRSAEDKAATSAQARGSVVRASISDFKQCLRSFFPSILCTLFLFRQNPEITMASANAIRARSLYRSVLRELPARPISSPSPIKLRLRATFSSSPSDGEVTRQRLDEGEQYVHYAKAQRMFATLLERYNPGMSMDEEERVRMTMKRVGMDAPKAFEWKLNNS